MKKDGKSAEAEDPVKKELEAKNKEILELKVCCSPLLYSLTAQSIVKLD